MREILKMDGYLLLKHWKMVFWLFFLFCTVGGAFSFWMIRGRGSGYFIQINYILAEMLFLAGSFLVPLSLILEDKEIGFPQLLSMPFERKSYAKAKIAEIFMTALFCFVTGYGGFIAGVLSMRPDSADMILPNTYLMGFFLLEMLMDSFMIVYFQLSYGAVRGLVYGILAPVIPLRILVGFVSLDREFTYQEWNLTHRTLGLSVLLIMALLALPYCFFTCRSIVSRCRDAVTDGDGLCQ